VKLGHDGRIWPIGPGFGDLGRLHGSRGRKLDHRRLRGTRQKGSRPKRACLQVGDGGPTSHVIRQFSQPAISIRVRTMRAGSTRQNARPVRNAAWPSRVRRANETSSRSEERTGQALRVAESYPHARDRRHGCANKIEDQWCRPRPCGQLAGLRSEPTHPAANPALGADHIGPCSNWMRGAPCPGVLIAAFHMRMRSPTMEPYCCSKSPKSAVWLHRASRSPFPPSSVL
jgi:hypothetical protein